MITFICGVPCAGKSTYRKKHFPDTPYVDIYDFQKQLPIRTHETIMRTYEQTIEKALELAKEGDVIIEQTLLKRFRRENAVNALREGGYEGEIHLIFIAPSRVDVLGRATMRLGAPRDIEDYVDKHLEIMELPETDEPFSSITVIEE